MSLPAPTYDRTAIMRDAHKRYRDGKRLGLGWAFGRCLSTAWQAAKMRRGAGEIEMRDLLPQMLPE